VQSETVAKTEKNSDTSSVVLLKKELRKKPVGNQLIRGQSAIEAETKNTRKKIGEN